MRRILFFCTLLLLSALPSWAQEGGTSITCAQRLRLARATYEAGRLHELVGTILGPEASTCFASGFTIQEKVDALKLLTLANIYLENPTDADNNMLELLRTDHFYDPDKASDPAEYLALYKTFRIDPVVSISGRFGGSLTLPTLLTVYTATPGVNGKFGPGVSFQMGLAAEKGFFSNAKAKILRDSEFIGEAMFVSRTFNQTDEELFHNGPNDFDIDLENDNTRAAKNVFKSKSGWIDLNLFVKYKLSKDPKKSKWDPYIGVGAGVSILLASDIDLIQTQRVRNNGTTLTATVTGPAIDVKKSFHSLANSATAIGGFKTKLGAIYLVFEGRAQFGLRNLVNSKTRSNREFLFDYNKQLNDYRQSNFSLNIGVTYPYFKPKKLSLKK